MSKRTPVGYIRVSTDRQDADMQRQAMLTHGVDPRCIFEETISGAKRRAQRPELQRCLDSLRPGKDVLVVYALDRASRSVSELIALMTWLEENDLQIRSLTQPEWDTTTPMGNFVFQLMAILAEFERRLIISRTRDGLEAARARGVQLGRKPKMDVGQVRAARAMLDTGTLAAEVCRAFGISKPTLYRHLRAVRDDAA